MESIAFDMHGKSVMQLKSYMAGIGYNEVRDYVDAPYSRAVASSGKHCLEFRESKAAANADFRWSALAQKGFKEVG